MTVFGIEAVHPVAGDFAAGQAGKVMISTKQDADKSVAYHTTAITTASGQRAHSCRITKRIWKTRRFRNFSLQLSFHDNAFSLVMTGKRQLDYGAEQTNEKTIYLCPN